MRGLQPQKQTQYRITHLHHLLLTYASESSASTHPKSTALSLLVREHFLSSAPAIDTQLGSLTPALGAIFYSTGGTKRSFIFMILFILAYFFGILLFALAKFYWHYSSGAVSAVKTLFPRLANLIEYRDYDTDRNFTTHHPCNRGSPAHSNA